MEYTSGYLLPLDDSRLNVFNSWERSSFAEPVSDFKYPRNRPLICFILNKKREITHFGFGRRGFRAGTDLRRLNISDINKLKKNISSDEITNSLDSKVKHHLVRKLDSGGLLPPKTFDAFLEVFLSKVPEATRVLNTYLSRRRLRIENLTNTQKKNLAEQKEAVLTAAHIANIDKRNLMGWDVYEGEEPISFLDGLPYVRHQEDALIVNDLNMFPGFEHIKNTNYSSTVFANYFTRLTIVLSNKQPLEELTGTDLLYFNESLQSFIFVQYKMMEKEGVKAVFRLPNTQLSEEISRMDSISELISSCKTEKTVNDYRVNQNPFFIKFCPRFDFDPDYVGLSKGMYIPLEYLKRLQQDDRTKGPRGGRFVSYENIGRYFDNTTFKMFVSQGWIGTTKNQSKVISDLIKTTIAKGKTVVVALKERIQSKNAESFYEGIIS